MSNITTAQVGIIMGSDSDFDIMIKAVQVLDEFGIESELFVASAHRTPERAFSYAAEAQNRGIKVIIAGAGAAAHLPGVLAAKTCLPVIGVPINATSLSGVDSLYAITQMPSGIPVATVAIDGSKNAGILAAQILALSDDKLKEDLVKFRKNMVTEVENKNERIQEKLRVYREAKKND